MENEMIVQRVRKIGDILAAIVPLTLLFLGIWTMKNALTTLDPYVAFVWICPSVVLLLIGSCLMYVYYIVVVKDWFKK